MFVQVGLQGKGLATSATGKGLAVGVRLNVSPEIGFVRKGLGANLAPKRSLA